jgi:hypothetical protein
MWIRIHKIIESGSKADLDLKQNLRRQIFSKFLN